MIRFSLADIAIHLDARLAGKDATFDGVGTDSRTLGPGALFVALRGERFDGHDYVTDVAERGAAGAVVERELPLSLPQLVVSDSRLALGSISALWRQAAHARVVALTGSNGKTTLKEMLAAILGQRGRVLATRGNLNNDIGVPLTLTRLQDEDLAVIELGANHPGEIDYLSRLASPEVAVLNNAGRAHLEGFGSLEGVARAKAEIINGLRDEGIFVFPGDSAWTPLWRDLAGNRDVLTFGTEGDVDVSAPADDGVLEWEPGTFRQAFTAILPGGEFRVELGLAGEHNRRNALAAIAAAHAMGIDMEAMATGLAAVRPVAGRLCPLHGRGAVTLVDDTYNANPDSVIAAIRVLATAPGRRVLVLGDLAELGEQSGSLHAELGSRARQYGLDAVLTLGTESRGASDSFGPGGAHFDELRRLLGHLKGLLSRGDTLLVKGSRAARMERVVAALRLKEERVAC